MTAVRWRPDASIKPTFDWVGMVTPRDWSPSRDEDSVTVTLEGRLLTPETVPGPVPQSRAQASSLSWA